MAEVENNTMSDISAIIELLEKQHNYAPHNINNSSLEKNSDEIQDSNYENNLSFEIPTQEEVEQALEKIGKENFSKEDIIEILKEKNIPKELIAKYLSAQEGYLKLLKNNSFNFIDIQI